MRITQSEVSVIDLWMAQLNAGRLGHHRLLNEVMQIIISVYPSFALANNFKIRLQLKILKTLDYYLV